MPMDPEHEDRLGQLLNQGNLLAAATLCEQHSDHRRALRLFEQACAFDSAARVARRIGDHRAAVRLTVLLKDDQVWQELLAWLEGQESDLLAELAAGLVADSRHAQAGTLYRLAGCPEQAASAFAQAGNHGEAAQAFERAGQVAKAAAVLEAGLRQAPAGRPQLRLMLGSIYSRYGKHEAAVRVLQRLERGCPERLQALPLLHASLKALGLEHALEELQLERKESGLDAAPVEVSQPEPAEGSQVLFGRYVIQSELAVTPHARLLKAKDRLTGEPVALKILATATHGAGRDALQRFVREAQALGTLRHPNVLPLLGYLAEGPAMVLRWMPGGSLEDLLQREPISPARAAEIACALLRALEQAHRLGILHRDIKPSNLLFDDGGTPHLADFGVAHLSAAEATVTAAAIGTVAYMSPEQRDGVAATTRSDLFAVGIMLRQMLTSEEPSVERNASPRPLSAYHPDLTAEHAGLLARLVAERPEERFATALEAREAIEQLNWSTRTVQREQHLPGPPSSKNPRAPASRRERLVESAHGPLGQQHIDRWLEREVVLLEPSEQARAAAFARASHPALASVLRVCPLSQAIWVALPPGQPVAQAKPFASLSGAQVHMLESALQALHDSGGVHGSVDATHVFRDGDGQVVLAMPRRCPSEASAAADRSALRLLAQAVG